MVHQIFADGGVAAGEEGELEFGADAVGRGDQHRLAIALQKKSAAEAADVGEHSLVKVLRARVRMEATARSASSMSHAGVFVTELFLFAPSR